MLRLLVAGVLAAGFGSTAGKADDTARIIAECDRLAASNLDPQRPSSVPGIPASSIDPKIAVPACESALNVAPEDPRTIFQLGRVYAAAKQFEKARVYLSKADALGHLLATNNLGALYADDEGVPVDLPEARRLYEKAAAGGLALAMNNIGKFYENGRGVPKDLVQAKLWYEKAAALGFGPAISSIGEIAYKFVLGRDFVTALEAADRPISLAPNKTWIYANRAHALMFLGRAGEARTIYLKYRGQNLQGDQSWSVVILGDFFELQNAGLNHPLMQDIEKLLGDDATNLQVRMDKLYDSGKYDEATRFAERLLAVQEKRFGPAGRQLVQTLDRLGVLYDHQARYDDAAAAFQRIITMEEKSFGRDHLDVGRRFMKLARVYRRQRRFARAEEAYKRAMEIYERRVGSEHPDLALLLHEVAGFYRHWLRPREAEPLYKRAVTICETACADPLTAVMLNDFGVFYFYSARYADAERLYHRALAMREQALGPESDKVAQTLDGLAVLYSTTGREAQSEQLYKRALAIREKALGPDSKMVGYLLINLGELYLDQNRYVEAEPFIKRALTIYQKLLPPNDHETAVVLGNLGLV